MNIELLKAVRDKIATTPEAYDQSVYVRTEPAAPCGTAACIAGWTCVLSGEMDAEELKRHERAGRLNVINITAIEALGIDLYEADVLFTEDPAGVRHDWYEDGERDGGWPEPFASQWQDDKTPAAQVAVAYLDHIIATGKVLE